MNIYKVSCVSDCGSYFNSYLKSVTCIAEDKNDAIKQTKAFLKKEGYNFIYKQEKWDIVLITNNLTKGILDYNYDSDY